ncbi:MAG: hypothetical protein Kow0088_21400 [Anaerolineales bacterium]
MENPLISLCMIVKNEQEYLPRCLESVQNVVDEIIIVDTGSTDGTKEIARKYGSKLFDIVWIDDFSAARNFSLEQANGRWILVMDADEELERDSGPRLRKLAQADEADAYWVLQRNFYKNRPQNTLDVPVLRFFRNCPTYRYRKRYHEENVTSIRESGGKIAKDPQGLIIFHYGYLHSTAQGKPRVERAIQTMQLALQEEPNNAWLLAKLGIDLYSIGRQDEAYAYLYRFATAEQGQLDYRQATPLDTHEALTYLGDLAMQRKEYTLAKYCGLAGRKLTDVFELRLYSEFAVLGGTLGETSTLLEQMRRRGDPPRLTSSDLSLLNQKLSELTELEGEINSLLEGFYTLLSSSQRNLLRSWKSACRQMILTIQRIIENLGT